MQLTNPEFVVLYERPTGDSSSSVEFTTCFSKTWTLDWQSNLLTASSKTRKSLGFGFKKINKFQQTQYLACIWRNSWSERRHFCSITRKRNHLPFLWDLKFSSAKNYPERWGQSTACATLLNSTSTIYSTIHFSQLIQKDQKSLERKGTFRFFCLKPFSPSCETAHF